MHALRWILAIVLPALGLAVTFVLAVLLTHGLVRLCPAELMVSGVCTAAWYPAAEQAALATAAFLGAVVFVSLPALAAPSHKPAVAWIALGAGLTFASIFVWQAGSGLLASFAAAVLGGAVAAFRVGRPWLPA